MDIKDTVLFTAKVTQCKACKAQVFEEFMIYCPTCGADLKMEAQLMKHKKRVRKAFRKLEKSTQKKITKLVNAFEETICSIDVQVRHRVYDADDYIATEVDNVKIVMEVDVSHDAVCDSGMLFQSNGVVFWGTKEELTKIALDKLTTRVASVIVGALHKLEESISYVPLFHLEIRVIDKTNKSKRVKVELIEEEAL